MGRKVKTSVDFAKLACGDGSRLNLDKIKVVGNRICSTDGHRIHTAPTFSLEPGIYYSVDRKSEPVKTALHDSDYPDLSQFFSQHFPFTRSIAVDLDELDSLVARFSRKHQCAPMIQFGQSESKLSFSKLEGSLLWGGIKLAACENVPFSLDCKSWFNLFYIADALSFSKNKTFEFSYSGNLSVCKITHGEAESFLMPIRNDG